MASNARGVRTPAPGGTYIGRPSGAGMGNMSIQPVANPFIPRSLQAGAGIVINGGVITALPPTITFVGDVTGSGTSPITLTLATVNSNLGTYASVVVNAKGLVTAAAALSGDATTAGSVLTFATVNSNVGTFQGITVNGKGLVTAAANQGYWVADADWAFTSHSLIANFNASSATATPTGGVHITAADATGAGFSIDTFQATPLFIGRAAGGTDASVAATPSGQNLAQFSGRGYGTSYTGDQGWVRIIATELWTASAAGTQVQIVGTPATTNTATTYAQFGKGTTSAAGGLSVGAGAADKGVGTINTVGAYFRAGTDIQTGKAATNKTTSSPGSVTATSPTYKMLGFAGTITPTWNTAVVVNFTGLCNSATLADVVTCVLSYGTSTAPSNGGTLAGTQIGSVNAFTQAVGGDVMSFSLTAVITGLSAGTAYWLDLAVGSSGGHAITFGSTNCAAFEI